MTFPLSQLALERQKARRIAMGHSIAQKRKSVWLTQDKLAKLLGWTRTTLVAIESGLQATTVDQLYLIADCLNFEIGGFLQYTVAVEEIKAKNAANGVFPIITSSGDWIADRVEAPPPQIAEVKPKKTPPRPSPARARSKAKKPAKKKVRKVKSKRDRPS